MQKIENYLNEDKTKLIFNFNYNEPLDDIIFPSTIQSIKFGDYFNQPIENVNWPLSLESIEFGKEFNQPIDKVKWPPSIQNISIGYNFQSSFNKSIENVIWPESIKQITFYGDMGTSIDNLPINLEILNIREISEPITNPPPFLKNINVFLIKKDVIKKCKFPFGCIVNIKLHKKTATCYDYDSDGNYDQDGFYNCYGDSTADYDYYYDEFVGRDDYDY